MTNPIDELIEKLRTPFPAWRQGTREYNFAILDYQAERAAAASALTSLQERNRKLEEALRPFADCVDQIDAEESDEEWAKFRLLIGDYRRAARALLSGGE